MCTGCVFVRRKLDLGVRAEDGRRSSRRGLAFMLTKGMALVEGRCMAIDR